MALIAVTLGLRVLGAHERFDRRRLACRLTVAIAV